MNKKKMLSCIIATLMCTSLFVGCNEINNKATTLSEKEKINFLNDLKLYSVDATHTISDMEANISKNIGAFEEKDKDEIISLYISQMYVSANDLDNKLVTIGYELEDVLKKDETIKVTDKKTWGKIPVTSGTVRGFLEEVKAKGFTLKRNSETSNYQISVDSQKIVDKYGNYMSASLKQYLLLNAYEETAPSLGNQDNKTVNLDEVVKRILMVEDGIKADKNKAHIDKWMSSADYYYSILLGFSHDFFVSSDYFNQDILTQYKNISQKNSGTKLAEVLDKVIKIYTDSNRKVDENVLAEIEKTVSDTLYTTEIKNALKVIQEARRETDLSTPSGSDTSDESVLDSIIPADAISEVEDTNASANVNESANESE